MELPVADVQQEVSVDLVAASYRSDSFPTDWSAEERARSFDRYCKWLRLKQRHPTERLAPTRDIDLFWHLHMLAPVAYNRDCQRLFGKLLDHDGGFGKGEGELPVLQQVFIHTAELWEAEYNEAYREDGQFIRDAHLTGCWHNCQSRCWHACSDIN